MLLDDILEIALGWCVFFIGVLIFGEVGGLFLLVVWNALAIQPPITYPTAVLIMFLIGMVSGGVTLGITIGKGK